MICSRCNTINLSSARFCTRCGDPLSLVAPEALPAAYSIDGRGDQSFYAGGGGEADRLIGRVIDGRYRVNARLGQGGMGVVYSAARLHIDDAVAIKFLRPELLINPNSLERFHREAKAAARLKHPNVVTIHDFGITHDRIAYLVMELIEGESLRSMVDRHGALTQLEAVEITSQICAALEVAHQSKIVHRDLKPDNIIVSKVTGGVHVKVLDFGIAKLRDLVTGGGSLTESGTVLGTPRYMSPEQCLGEELDGRSDIYSLGVVVYEMLTGATPFNSPSIGSLILQHVSHTPPPLRSINMTVSPAIEAAVAGALEKRREDRPQSAVAFAEALKTALRTEAAVFTIERASIGSQSAGGRQISQSIATPSVMTAGDVRTDPNQWAGSSRGAKTQTARTRLVFTAIVIFALAIAAAGWRLWSTDKQIVPVGRDDAGMANTDPALREKPPTRGAGVGVEAIEKTLAQAESDFRNQRYDAVISACTDILAARPNQMRADLLLGESYYNTGSARSAEYLARAIDMGETTTLPIKHHHYEGALKINEGLCSGHIKLNKTTFEFHSDENSAHAFSVPTDKIYDLRDESYKGGRLHLKIGLQSGGTELAQDYNFYAPPAGLRRQLTIIRVYCENPACQPMAQTVYQLLARFKK